MDLKKALLISFVSHCFVLAPLGSFWFFSPRPKNSDIRITYCQVKPPKTELIKVKTEEVNVSALNKAAAEKKMTKAQHARAAARKQEPTKKVDIAPQQKVRELKSIPGTTLPNIPQCVDYYNYIRQEIQRSLRRDYTSEYPEGEVIVAFILNRAGELVSLGIRKDKSIGDEALQRLAYESVRRAAPFREFPKGFSRREITFELPVVFKKR